MPRNLLEAPVMDSPFPCSCGTGRYCKRHKRYGLSASQPKTYVSPNPESLQHACGGGRRVIRKEHGVGG